MQAFLVSSYFYTRTRTDCKRKRCKRIANAAFHDSRDRDILCNKNKTSIGHHFCLFFLKNTVVDVHLGHVGHEIKLFYLVRFAFSFVRIEFN